MKVKDIKCDYCNKHVPEQKDEYPTWFGRYEADKLKMAICVSCLKDNREKWRKGVK